MVLDRPHALLQLLQIEKSLKQYDIGAGVRENDRLFLEDLVDFVCRPHHGIVGKLLGGQRANRTRHKGLSVGSAAGQSHARRVDVRQAIRQAIALQAAAACAIGVRFQKPRASLHVVLVNRLNQIGPRQIEFVEVDIQPHAAGVQFRAHRPVTDEHAVFERIQKIRFQEFLLVFRSDPFRGGGTGQSPCFQQFPCRRSDIIDADHCATDRQGGGGRALRRIFRCDTTNCDQRQ